MIYSLITGGTSGLGYELAKILVRIGKNVIIIGRDEQKLNNSIKELK
jgi:short-subunit dehydrogenase